MATVLNFKGLTDGPESRRGSVTRKHGSKKLYVDFYYRGHRIVKSTGMDDTPVNEKSTEQWLDKVMTKINDGTFVFAEAFPGATAEEKTFFPKFEGWEYAPGPKDISFGDYIPEWRKRFLDNCKSQSKKRDQEQIIDYWLFPYFEDKTFHQITGVALKEFVLSLKRRPSDKRRKKPDAKVGQALSASRIRNVLIPLRAIWADAAEENRWILPDPFAYLKKQPELPTRKKRTKQRYDVFRFDDWMAMLENLHPYYRPVAEVMIMTGMIGSEIAGLRKIDIMEDKIWIRNSIVRNHEKQELKTEYRERELPISIALRERLDTAISQAEGEYVFTMKNSRIFDVDSFRKNPWARALQRAGLSYRVPYTTRHSFAAWALLVGIDQNKLVSLMGHGSKEMVYEVYGKYVDGLEKDAGKIKDYFGKYFMGLD